MALDYKTLKKQYLANPHNDTVEVSPLVEAYATAEDGWTYLESLTTKELLAIKAQLFADGIESDYVKADASQGRIVFVVNKALTTALS